MNRFAKGSGQVPNTLAHPGISAMALNELLDAGALRDLLSPDARRDAYASFERLHSGRQAPGRYWKIDLDALALPYAISTPAGAPEISGAPGRGVIACDLATAARDHRALFERGFGRAIRASDKFAHLTRAFADTGAFIYIPADICIDEPIVITHQLLAGANFPYTLVLAEAGSTATVIEEFRSTQADVFACGVLEVIAAEGASIATACMQELPQDATVITTRNANPGANATINICIAELGARLAVSAVDIAANAPGVDMETSAVFFPRGEQHVDLVTTVDHLVGDTQSTTMVKSAATDHGQARYLGNIRIAANAHRSNASLRDDALLLSTNAHIDSVPALEIAANDVKAFHGATVGAIDEEMLFYMTSRGLARQAAEKMIALGFFAPAIDRFPTQALRDRIGVALEAKVSA